MTTLREAAQQALEALEWYAECSMVVEPAAAAMTALRAALADGDNLSPTEPVQEPVAWTYEWKHRLHGGSLNVSRTRWPESHLWIETPLYAAPPQRKPLTEERNFCPRCGKRTQGIHTCTPPGDCDVHG